MTTDSSKPRPGPSSAARQLRELTRTIARLQRASLIDCDGISAAQCHVLTALGSGGEITLAELVLRLRLDKGWVSRTLAALESEGLVRRRTDPADRRQIRIQLSARGQRRARKLDQRLDAGAQELLDRIPAQRRARVAKSLELLWEAAAARQEEGEDD